MWSATVNSRKFNCAGLYIQVLSLVVGMRGLVG